MTTTTQSGEKSRHEIRLSLEEREAQILSPYAALSKNSKGRCFPDEPCAIRTCFQRDRDKIIHSKAFRRLKHKTQVFVAPTGDHYRTRLTHSLEVAQISRTAARALKLNEDLTEAIALGHDLGHPPFGHSGEAVLDGLYPKGFHHEEQSTRTVTIIEPLNLTHEVLSGISNQLDSNVTTTLEASLVKIADRMTYLHHDVEDAMRAGLMVEDDVPDDIQKVLGRDRQSRLDTMVFNLIQTTQKSFDAYESKISLSSDIEEAILKFRKWMFDCIYLAEPQMAQKQNIKRLITGLYEFYCTNPDKLSPNVPIDNSLPETEKPFEAERRVVDYIAGMTDRFALQQYISLLLPTPYNPDGDLFSEVIQGVV